MRRTRVEEACSERNFRAWSRSDFWSGEKSKFIALGSYGIGRGGATTRRRAVLFPEILRRIKGAVSRQVDSPARCEHALPAAAQLDDPVEHAPERAARTVVRAEEGVAPEPRALDDADEPQEAGRDLACLDDVAALRQPAPLGGARAEGIAAASLEVDLPAPHRLELDPVEIVPQRSDQSVLVDPPRQVVDRDLDPLAHGGMVAPAAGSCHPAGFRPTLTPPGRPERGGEPCRRRRRCSTRRRSRWWWRTWRCWSLARTRWRCAGPPTGCATATCTWSPATTRIRSR